MFRTLWDPWEGFPPARERISGYCWSAEGKGFLKENPVFLKDLQEKERSWKGRGKGSRRELEEENKTPHASSALGHGGGFVENVINNMSRSKKKSS